MSSKIVIVGDSTSNHIVKWAKGVQSGGYNVTVISCGGRKIDGIETLIFGKTGDGLKAYLKYNKSVRRQIYKLNPDLIHAFQATGYAYWAAVDINCPKILSPLGSDITISGRKNIFYRQFQKHFVRKYDYFTTPSQSLKENLIRYHPHCTNKTAVIPFGVLIPEKSVAHRNKDETRIVYMKHLLPVYGPDVLLHALQIIKSKNIGIKVDLFGFEHEAIWVKELADKLKVSSMIEFPGWIDMDLVLTTLLDYDMMVMPSRSESFGVAALEASAVGLPVVATNVGGIPEIIEDGVTGILVSPEDPQGLAEALIMLATDAGLREKMGQAGRKRASEKFEWSNNLAEIVKLYEHLISGEEAN